MIATIIAMAFVFAPVVALAQVSLGFPSSFAGFSSQDLVTTIENIVRIVLGFIGIIFMIVVLYGGAVWMTSKGAPEKIDKAKKILTSGVIGLLIVLSSYAIAAFIIGSYRTSLSGTPGSGSGGPGILYGYGTALGAGILESHYPTRFQKDVPRNTQILITFKEDIVLNSICRMADVTGPAGSGPPDGIDEQVIIPGAIKINDYDSKVSPDLLEIAPEDDFLEIVYCDTIDNKTFKFNPGGSSGNHLGLSTESVRYQVSLTSDLGNNWIIKASDNDVALDIFGYQWFFTVSTFLDTTPPILTHVYPAQSSFVPRNALVMLTFNEPIDPVTASGFYSGGGPFTNITVDGGGLLDGQYRISNGYKTIEFYPDNPCGTNSCGDPVYCLPATTRIYVNAKDQIFDLASNGFDCEDGGGLLPPVLGKIPSGDGTASCPPNNFYEWYFDTNATMDLEGPFIESRVPHNNDLNATVNSPVVTTFNEIIIPSTVNTNVYMFNYADALCDDGPVPFWTGVTFVDSILPLDGIADVSEAYLYHDRYWPLTDYCPIVTHKIKDAQQNCYLPAACDIGGPAGVPDGVIDASVSYPWGDDGDGTFGVVDGSFVGLDGDCNAPGF